MNAWYYLVPLFLPLILACAAPFAGSKKSLHQGVAVLLGLELFVCCVAALRCVGSFTALTVGDFSLTLTGDTLGRIFSVMIAVVFLLCGLFSFEYFHGDERESTYWVFYLLTLTSLQGLCFAANLYTFYLFYEMMTFCSFPLVLHERTLASRKAAMQYLGYSLLGGSLALFGFFFVPRFCYGTAFAPGGILNSHVATTNPRLVLFAAFCMLLGFGSKAGMFPLHAWLPIAHPEAPAPASAVLSGVITKGGVLGIIRVAYYVFGAELLRGTWVQTALLSLSLITVFMGSMLAFKENLLKRRLAWSTVSQVSYVLFGLFLFCADGFTGALLQVVYHAFAKVTLFLSAGAIIHNTGYTKVDQLRGVGRQMPITFWCFALGSLSLVGIPPLAGFVSKWMLAQGSLTDGGSFALIGVIVLIVSALLTAGYLLTVVSVAFFPGKDWPVMPKTEPGPLMTVPLLIGGVSLVLLGLFPFGLTEIISRVVADIL